MHGKKILSLFLLLPLVLSAFRPPEQPRPDPNAKIILQFLTAIQSDGSSEFQLVVKISKAQIQTLSTASGYSESTICHNMTSQLQNNIGGFTQKQHGEDIWCTASKNFDNLDALKKGLADDFNRLTVRRLEIQSGTFYLDLYWNGFPCTTPDATQFSCEWAVQMPGTVGANNATRVEGTTAIWDMSVSATPFNFTAQSALSGGWTTAIAIVVFLLCGCCMVILLIGGGIAAYLILRRRNAPPAAPKPGTSPDAAGPAGPVALS